MVWLLMFVVLIAVIPAKSAERARAGIHLFSKPLDSRLRGNDDKKYAVNF